MSDDTASVDLSVLLLPLTGRLLVVPSVVVVEIIKRRELRPPAQHAPGWLGTFVWRGSRIPAVSFEALNADTSVPDAGSGSRLVVMNTLSDPENRRHYAILTQGVPHLMRLTPADVIPQESVRLGPAERMRVHAHGQLAAIPDLDYVERQVAAFPSG
jgi:chemosensory pili system protein ChpC